MKLMICCVLSVLFMLAWSEEFLLHPLSPVQIDKFLEDRRDIKVKKLRSLDYLEGGEGDVDNRLNVLKEISMSTKIVEIEDEFYFQLSIKNIGPMGDGGYYGAGPLPVDAHKKFPDHIAYQSRMQSLLLHKGGDVIFPASVDYWSKTLYEKDGEDYGDLDFLIPIEELLLDEYAKPIYNSDGSRSFHLGFFLFQYINSSLIYKVVHKLEYISDSTIHLAVDGTIKITRDIHNDIVKVSLVFVKAYTESDLGKKPVMYGYGVTNSSGVAVCCMDFISTHDYDDFYQESFYQEVGTGGFEVLLLATNEGMERLKRDSNIGGTFIESFCLKWFSDLVDGFVESPVHYKEEYYFSEEFVTLEKKAVGKYVEFCETQFCYSDENFNVFKLPLPENVPLYGKVVTEVDSLGAYKYEKIVLSITYRMLVSETEWRDFKVVIDKNDVIFEDFNNAAYQEIDGKSHVVASFMLINADQYFVENQDNIQIHAEVELTGINENDSYYSIGHFSAETIITSKGGLVTFSLILGVVLFLLLSE